MKFLLNKKAVLTYYLLLTTYSFFAQETRNLGFTKPMNLPFNLAGSFGEPRPDHFHSGIDIKTNGVEGEPVFAVYDGYISRIRVSPYGYGRAIYITHTNGYTSVYGHLSRFSDAIQKYVNTQHYLTKQSELDLTFDGTKFPIKQNDTIAFSGNTGGSSAPHLHFEIRNTKTEHALNPLDFYPRSFYIDTIPPQINWIQFYSTIGSFYDRIETYSTNLVARENFYTTVYPINIKTQLFGISVDGFDKQDSSTSKNGIYRIRTLCNNKILFQYTLNEIDFDKTRMCNAFIDYESEQRGNVYYYNTLKLPRNKLTIYDSVINNGLIDIQYAIKYGIDIEFYDYNLNKSTIKLNFTHNDSFIIRSFVFDSIYIRNNNINTKNFKMKFSQDAFYDNAGIICYEKQSNQNDILSNIFEVAKDRLIPLQKAAKIEFKSSIKKNRNKIVVVRQDFKGKETALKTTFDKTKFYAETKELGSFYLKYDTTKPTIEILNLKDKIQAKILDNLSGINMYNGYIDNNWVNFYYDSKNDIIEYTFDEYCTKGEHSLKITVTDNVGNKSTFTQKFIH